MNTTARATVWSLTIANPTESSEEEIAMARQKGWTVIGQIELGEGGLRHYQIMLKTPQLRFSAIKKQFPTAHIEIARNPKALELYVNKEETRAGQLPSSQEKYPSLSRYWDFIYQYCERMNYIDYSETKFAWWKDANRKEALTILDEATDDLIRHGYFVEGIASNPSTRTSFKKYSLAILERAYDIRQTDRQTNPDLDSVQIPTFPVPPYEHTSDADDSDSEVQEDEESEDEVEDDAEEESCSDGEASSDEGW